ncbi:MAG: DUF898 family protein [Rubrivivax sp.]|nr:MAG: DUF898 family protein [Rubrivivax sp.]
MQNPTVAYARHPVVFTGSETEYRRLWLRNVALLLITVGASFPWAMVSKARYFYRHTQVAGHALAYHANPLKLFLGNLAGSVVLNSLYFGISKTGSFKAIGFGAVQLLMGLLTPLMLHGLLEFKLTHTSWRGQRLGLSARPHEAFKALGLPTLAYVLSAVLVVWALVISREPQIMPALWLGGLGLAGLSFALPWMYWRFKNYQHRHAVLGPIQNEHDTARHSWREWGACVGAALMTLLALAVSLLLAWGLSSRLGLNAQSLDRLAQGHLPDVLIVVLVTVPSVFLGTAIIMALPYPYLSVHLQNRLWARTGHHQLRFESEVPLGPLLKLTARNWVLIVLTLGFYYPHAAIAEARLRLQSVSVLLPLEEGHAG